MFTREFMLDAIERGIKTGAQAGLIYVGAQQINAWQFDWLMLLGYILGGIALSIITSFASYNIGNKGTASLTEEVEYVAPVAEEEPADE